MQESFLAILVAALAATLVVVNPNWANAGANRPDAPRSAVPTMRVYGPANPPYGFVDFCNRNPSECREHRASEQRVVMSPARWSELESINRWANASIKPATDQETFGVTEYWTLPSAQGDCEEYVLLKRQLLLARGWPASVLLITVVLDERREGHAVLTVRTSQGDFILDNKLDGIRAWHETPYAFIMRQSYLNPRVWVSLDPSDALPNQALSGLAPVSR